MARRKASVSGLRVCRHSNEVGGLIPSNKVVPQMYFHASVLVWGQVRFLLRPIPRDELACWASRRDCKQSQSLVGQGPTSIGPSHETSSRAGLRTVPAQTGCSDDSHNTTCLTGRKDGNP